MKTKQNPDYQEVKNIIWENIQYILEEVKEIENEYSSLDSGGSGQRRTSIN
jgi:hypothetical protein